MKPVRDHGRLYINRLNKRTKHLFLLSPPLSGSTVLAQLIRTSKNTSGFPGMPEGQLLPKAINILHKDERYDPAMDVDWKMIKDIFHSKWLVGKRVHFEKSPPHIVRAKSLEKHFCNAHFIILIRNPYAVIEGLLRRGWTFNDYGPNKIIGVTSKPLMSQKVTPKIGAEFWLRCALFQRKNHQELRQTYFLKYEQLTDYPVDSIRKIMEFIPEIGQLDYQAKFSAHNITGKAIRGLQNLNKRQIANLSPEQILDINRVLKPHEGLLDYYGYDLLE